jgi:hypothetical protein
MPTKNKILKKKKKKKKKKKNQRKKEDLNYYYPLFSSNQFKITAPTEELLHLF